MDTGRDTFVAEKGSVDRITNLLSRMSTVDFADTLQTARPSNRRNLNCRPNWPAARPSTLSLAPKDEEGNQYFLRKNGASSDFVIYKSTAQVLMKRPDDFKAKAAGSRHSLRQGQKQGLTVRVSAGTRDPV